MAIVRQHGGPADRPTERIPSDRDRLWVIFDLGSGLCRAAYFHFARKADIRSLQKIGRDRPGRTLILRVSRRY
jgi:hypothetical protein